MKYILGAPIIVLCNLLYYGLGGALASIGWLLFFLWHFSYAPANKSFRQTWKDWEWGDGLFLSLLLSVIFNLFGLIFVLSFLVF